MASSHGPGGPALPAPGGRRAAVINNGGMTAPSPFVQLAENLDRLAGQLEPPAWLTEEWQRRLVQFLNHVLQQSPEARARVARQQGRVVRLQWRRHALQLLATSTGLCELAPQAGHDLLLTVTEPSPLALAWRALQGERPQVQVEGDPQMAADASWLAEHLRWDTEHDLARLVGDAPARALADAGRAGAQALHEFIRRWPGTGKAGP